MLKIDPFTLTLSYWGLRPHDFDRPGVIRDSICSRVTNRLTGNVFIILTSQELLDDSYVDS